MSARSRKRDNFKLHNPFRRTRSSSPSPAAPTPPRHQLTPPSVPPHPQSDPIADQSRVFLNAALSDLEVKEQTIVKAYLTNSVVDINEAIAKSHDAALKKKQVCEDKRWHWTFCGRTYWLQDVAGKLIHGLNRLKLFGDAAGSIDPIHVGLPWAGIRMILELAVSGMEHMATLLTGMELAMRMANRLQVYYGSLKRLASSALSTKAFENTLVKFYTHILHFIAIAIDTYQEGTAARTWRLMWNTSSLKDFEADCRKLAQEAEIEASICGRQIDELKWEAAKGWKHDLDNALKGLDFTGLSTSIAVLQDKVDLAGLQCEIVKDALYDSFADRRFQGCLEGTRTDLLHQIETWADSVIEKPILWLCGKAGTGKSAIARTIARRFDKERNSLGASFFFRRGDGDRASARRFFPTLAAQLWPKIPGMGHAIAEILIIDPNWEKNLPSQFENLLLKPLQTAAQSQTANLCLFIVIDALDECESEEDVQTILTLLGQIQSIQSLRLRIFVTSRPELPFNIGFGALPDDALHQGVKLEEIQTTTIERDIRICLEHGFKAIRDRWLTRRALDRLPEDWPTADDIQALVKWAVPLFIFASTILRYVSGTGLPMRINPRRRLEEILEKRHDARLYEDDYDLVRTYLPILDQVVSEYDREDDIAVAEFHEVVGPIVVLAEPLSVNSLGILLSIEPYEIDGRIISLQSVLEYSPENWDEVVRPLHVSFHDFLVEPKQKGNSRFWVDEAKVHFRLAERCLQLLMHDAGGLKQDVCGFRKPGTRRNDIDEIEVAKSIPTSTSYACRYWIWHLSKSREHICDSGTALAFLEQRFLYWIEALSWLGKTSDVMGYLETLFSLLNTEQSPRLQTFLKDAQRFMLKNQYIVDSAPLQLYSSALTFAPTQSVIRSLFQISHCDEKLFIVPNGPTDWGAEIMKLERHKARITAVAFSNNWKIVASGSQDHTCYLWDTTIGKPIYELTDLTHPARAIAFSPDDGTVALGYGKTIQLWNSTNGQKIHCLEGHSGWIEAIAFSANGRHLASASSDKIVRLWDARTGKPMHSLEGHSDLVLAVAFSTIGETVLSVSLDNIIWIWNVESGVLLRKIEGKPEFLLSAAISKDASMVASAFSTIIVIDVASGNEIYRLKGHESKCLALAFSPNGERIASALQDHTVRLWDTTTGNQLYKFEGHTDPVRAVTFSNDGRMIISASEDRTVRLWDATVMAQINKPREVKSVIKALVFSTDGNHVVSISGDDTVLVWDPRKGNDVSVPGRTWKSFFSDSNISTLASKDDLVRLWNATDSEAICVLKKPNEATQTASVDISPDRKLIASTSAEDIFLWDVSTGNNLHRLKGHTANVNVLAFAPDGQTLLSAGLDMTIRLWSIEHGGEIQNIADYDSRVTAATFSPDGGMYAVAFGNMVHLRSTKDGKINLKLTGEGDINVLSFSGDGTMLATASSSASQSTTESVEHAVWVWDAVDGRVMQKIMPCSLMTRIAFAKDNSSLDTNIGTLQLSSSKQVRSDTPKLSLRGEWIQFQDRDHLWLPPEYRGTTSTTDRDTLAIGQVSGEVSFFSLLKNP